MTKISKMISAVVMFIMMFILLQSPIMVFAEDIEKNIKSKQKEKSITAVATSKELQDTLSEDLMSSLQEAGVKMYASKEEYEAELKASGEELMAQVAAMEKTPIWHTFTVRDKKTGAPISGAVIVLDGVPRFSDINGQIQVKMMNDVVELKVEKNGYNPYVEYYDVYTANENGTKEKVVYIKQPSDDLEIYSAVLDCYGDKANVMEQSYTFDKFESYNDTMNISVASSDADMYYLYKGDQLISQCSDGNFQNVPINSMEVKQKRDNSTIKPLEGDLKVVTEKQGILSKAEKLNLAIFEMESFNILDVMGGNISNVLNFDIDPFEFIGSFKIDYMDKLKEALKIDKTKWNVFDDLGIGVSYDNMRGSYKFTLGVNLDLSKLKKQEKNAIVKKFEKSYKMRKKNINPKAKPQSTAQALWGAFKKVSRDGLSLKAVAMDVNVEIPIEFVGYIELSHRFFTGEVTDSSAILGGGIEFSIGFFVDHTKHFFLPVPVIVTLPVYINFGMGGDIGIDWDYDQMAKMQHVVKLIVGVKTKLGFGVGIKGLFSAGIYGKADFDFIVNLTKPSDSEANIFLSCGFLISIIGFDYDIAIVDEYKIVIPEKKLSTLAAESVETSQNYLDARPSSVYLDGKKLSVWVEKDLTRDKYNATKLMYSYGDIIGSVCDDGKSDYYPELEVIDGEAYVVWHKNAKVVNGDDMVGSVFADSTVMLSKFNKITNSFDVVKQFDMDGMTTLPKIVKDSTANNLSVAWFSNTNNDPLGTSGLNKIYTSTLKNGVWSAPDVLFEINKPITSYDATFIDGKIYFTGSVDMDANYATNNDLDIYFGCKDNVSNISNDSVMQDSPMFGVLNGEPVMYYLQNNSIYMSKLDGEQSQLVCNSQNPINSFEVLQNAGQVLYVTSGEESQQLFLAKYDFASEKWMDNILINSEYQYISIDVCSNGDEMEIQGVAFTPKEDSSGLVIEGVKSEIVKLVNDIEFVDAYMLEGIKTGNNDIYMIIKNCGSSAIDTFTYSINGENYNYTLEESLLPSAEKMISIQWNCSTIPENLKIVLAMDNEDILDNNTFVINTNYADIDFEINQRLVDNKEILDFKISNLMAKQENIRIVIRKENKNGEIIYCSNKMLVLGNSTISHSIDLDYANFNLDKGDKLDIEVVAEKDMLIPCTKSMFIAEKVQYYDDNMISDITNMLNTAKKILGGVV